jgi:DNA-binding beta-propeller fold protein YncE
MLKIEITITKPQLKFDHRIVKFQALLLALVLALTFVSRSRADSGTCNGQTITLPFTDVMGNSFFCFIAQIYFQGITLGTSPTTYSPSNNVTRDQMAVFLARTQNSALNRGSRRAAHNQFWTTVPQYSITQGAGMLGTTVVGNGPRLVASDGADLWLANGIGGSVSRVRGSDGKRLETWTNAESAYGVLVVMGRVFVTGATSPGRLYLIDPSQPVGDVTTLSSGLGNNPLGIAFDGRRLWTANNGSVSIITPGAPFTVSSGFTVFGDLQGILYDGANIWVTELGRPGRLIKLDAIGAVLATATVGWSPNFPIFDGTNIWVPNGGSDSVSVVRPSDGAVLATLTGNGLNNPVSAAFDGQRILVTNLASDRVSLFRAADFAPLGNFSTGAGSEPLGACSDGLNFWIALSGPDKLARF